VGMGSLVELGRFRRQGREVTRPTMAPRHGSTVPWSMIVSIQAETDVAGHARHLLDVGRLRPGPGAGAGAARSLRWPWTSWVMAGWTASTFAISHGSEIWSDGWSGAWTPP
jgi:hypothetical protein